MADSVIKTVVVELETKYNQEGQKAAAAGLSELGKQAKSLKDTVLDNITRIDKAYSELGKKKITPNDKSFVEGYLKGIQKELNSLIANWDKLSKTQQESASQLIKKTNDILKEFKLLDETQKDLDKSSKQVKESTSSFLDSVSLLTPALGKYGFAVDKAVTSLNEYLKASDAGDASNSQIGKGLEFLKSKWAGVGVAIAAVGGAMALVFQKTAEGSEELKIKLDALSLVTENRLTIAANKLLKLFQGDLKGAFSRGDGGRGITLQRAEEISRSNLEIEKVINQLELRNAQIDIAIQKDRVLAAEQATNLINGNEQLKAIIRVRKADDEIDKNNITIAELKLEALKNELSVKKQLLPIDQKRLNDAQILVDIQKAEAEKGDIRFIKNQTAKESELDAIKKNFNTLLSDLDKAVDEFNFQDTFGKIFNPNLSEFDKAKLERDLQALSGELNSKLKQISELSGGGLSIPIELKANVKKLQDRAFEIIKKLRDGIAFELLKQRGDNGTPSLDLQINTDKPKKAAEIKAERDAERDKEKEAQKKAFQDAQREAENALNAFFELELKKTDFLINEQQRRVDKLQEIAALGNAEQLQLEEERLNKLIQKREEAAKRQAQIDSLVKLSNTGVAISNYVKAITESAGSRTPIVAILESVALLASIFAGITQLKGAFQGFEEGTLNVSSDPRTFKPRGKSDTIPAWLAPGEAILPVEVASEIRKQVSSVHEIPKMLKRSSNTYGIILNDNQANATYNFRNIEALMQENNRLLNKVGDLIHGTEIDINFDHVGYKIQQKKKARQDHKHKLQRR